MAANQTVYDDNKNWHDDAYDLVTISDEDYDALKKGTKFDFAGSHGLKSILIPYSINDFRYR